MTTTPQDHRAAAAVPQRAVTGSFLEGLAAQDAAEPGGARQVEVWAVLRMFDPGVEVAAGALRALIAWHWHATSRYVPVGMASDCFAVGRSTAHHARQLRSRGGWGCGGDVRVLGAYRCVRPLGEEALPQHELLDLARSRERELLQHSPVARCLVRCEVLAAVRE